MHIRSKFSRTLFALALGLTTGLTTGHAQAINVFACEPEWAALTRVLLPDANISVATHADQDPHHIEARPSLIAALRRADLAVCTGASLETGWLPMLQSRASNSVVRTGAPGMFFAAEHSELLNAGQDADRSGGDVHPEGNPHLHLDPDKVPEVARALADTIAKVDPSSAQDVKTRLSAFEKDWSQHKLRWAEKRQQLQGKGVVIQHTAFSYILAYLGVAEVADLEPLPGLPPTLSHLQSVLEVVSSKAPVAIIQTRYQRPQSGQWLAERIDRPLLSLPSTVTDDEASDELHELIDLIINALLKQTNE